MDLVRLACHNDQARKFPLADCDEATDYGDTSYCRGNLGEAQNCSTTMNNAFKAVRDGTGGAQCIGFEYDVGGPSRTWFGLGRGTWRCA